MRVGGHGLRGVQSHDWRADRVRASSHRHPRLPERPVLWVGRVGSGSFEDGWPARVSDGVGFGEQSPWRSAVFVANDSSLGRRRRWWARAMVCKARPATRARATRFTRWPKARGTTRSVCWYSPRGPVVHRRHTVLYRAEAANDSVLSLLAGEDELWLGRRAGARARLRRNREDDFGRMTAEWRAECVHAPRAKACYGADAKIRVASGAGLLRIGSDDKAKRDTSNGLPNNLVTRLLIDGDVMWVGTGGWCRARRLEDREAHDLWPSKRRPHRRVRQHGLPSSTPSTACTPLAI